MEARQYKQAGVDIVKNERFVASIKRLLGLNPRVCPQAGVGGFAGLFALGDDSYLCASSDGVGTKLMLARQAADYHRLGIDLVAMNVNDLICCGARPLFFLDYLSYSCLEFAAMEELIAGIIAGCEQADCLLLGGETAEMPGLYQAGKFDLAGFAVGLVSKNQVISGQETKAGDMLIGLAASGFHANGFSLIRTIIGEKNLSAEVMDLLLEPTSIYVRPVLKILREFPGAINGIAHITGSGFHNIRRISPQHSYHIAALPPVEEIAPIFSLILDATEIPLAECYSTFNMGIGMVLVVKPHSAEQVLQGFRELGVRAWLLGETAAGKGEIVIERIWDPQSSTASDSSRSQYILYPKSW